MITFLGTQPTLTQVPPNALNSTTPTFAPYPFKYNNYYVRKKKEEEEEKEEKERKKMENITQKKYSKFSKFE